MVLRLFLIASLGHLAWSWCPDKCTCSNSEAICENKRLDQIPRPPDGLSKREVPTKLYFSGNPVSSPYLTSKNFTGWENLSVLRLRGCGISSIAPQTFAGLSELDILDISYNAVILFDVGTFTKLRLSFLNLEKNGPNLVLAAGWFAGGTVESLNLNSNGISQLSVDMLPQKPQLQRLMLYNNSLAKLSNELEPNFRALRHLNMSLNPLHCNCELNWLKKMSEEEGAANRIAKLTCASPNEKADTSFDHWNFENSNFTCFPPIVKATSVTFGPGGGVKISCSASGDPVPTIFWSKSDGKSYYPKTDKPFGIERQSVLELDMPVIPGRTDSFFCNAVNKEAKIEFKIEVTYPDMPACPSPLPLVQPAYPMKEQLVSTKKPPPPYETAKEDRAEEKPLNDVAAAPQSTTTAPETGAAIMVTDTQLLGSAWPLEIIIAICIACCVITALLIIGIVCICRSCIIIKVPKDRRHLARSLQSLQEPQASRLATQDCRQPAALELVHYRQIQHQLSPIRNLQDQDRMCQSQFCIMTHNEQEFQSRGTVC